MTDTNGSFKRPAACLYRIITWLAVGLLPVLQPAAGDLPLLEPFDKNFMPAPMNLCESAADGFVSGDLYGALRQRIEWRGSDMDCGGMLRPDNEGIRLVFAAPRQGERLLIVLGIDGKLDALPDGEHVTNITIVDEAYSRFFSTGRQDRCWSTIESIRPAADNTDRIVEIIGEVYCAGSLPSLSDNTSVTLRNVHYSGRLKLDEPDQE